MNSIINRRHLLARSSAVLAASAFPVAAPTLAEILPGETVVPGNADLLSSYNAWLFNERRALAELMYPG